MKVTMKCLVDYKTGEPVELNVPDDDIKFQEDLAWASRAGQISGERFKLALNREYRLEKALKQCIQAIEGGTPDGDCFIQRFGPHFVQHLKDQLEP